MVTGSVYFCIWRRRPEVLYKRAAGSVLRHSDKRIVHSHLLGPAYLRSSRPWRPIICPSIFGLDLPRARRQLGSLLYRPHAQRSRRQASTFAKCASLTDRPFPSFYIPSCYHSLKILKLVEKPTISTALAITFNFIKINHSVSHYKRERLFGT